ncbi:MAG: ATP-binding cassette domain-containing protein [Armatimonadetes bacterium]|nr:ATP-binding cassette domain-containing protein [Armatimonadota bacterium]
MGAPLAELRNVSKAYGGVRALDGVSLIIEQGEVHALCGENGAGKSTLNNVLAGVVQADSGEIIFMGELMNVKSVRDAEKLGVTMIHQELVAFPHLAAPDNIFIGREPTKLAGLLLDRARMDRESKDLIERLKEEISLTENLEDLSTAARQMIGIARALAQESKLLIMDEPTASLSTRETEVLFQVIRDLKANGISVLYVSHRLNEVFEIADRVTVLKDGRFVATSPTADLTQPELIKLMVGRDIGPHIHEETKTGEPRLVVKNLSVPGSFRDVSFEVKAGEIVALAGLVGAGRSEVVNAIFGIDHPTDGSIRIDDQELELGSPEAAKRAGVALIPEDRQHQGLVLQAPISENISLSSLNEISSVGLIDRRKEQTLADDQIKQLDIRVATTEDPAQSLSGGNQQKVLVAKWLATEPDVMILDEPTRGVDVGAKAEIHRLIKSLAADGAAVLVVSSELPEVLALADRIIVMREGRISGQLDRKEATEESILKLALPSERSEARRTQQEVSTLSRIFARREYGVLALLLLALTAVSVVNPGFLTVANFVDSLVKISPVVIAACGVTFVLLAKEIDISVGSMMGLVAAMLGLAVSAERWGWPIWAGIGLAIAVGTIIGALNGFLVAVTRVPSIIVTLAMLSVLKGVTELAMQGEWITDVPSGVRFFGTGSVAGVPVSILLALSAVAVSSFVLAWTPFGHRVRAVGSNAHAAHLSGVSLKKIRWTVFAISGLFVSIATLITATQIPVIESGIGTGFELLVITCVVVGGTSIQGGRGTIFGTVVGVALLGLTSTFLIFLKLGEALSFWERAIQGTVILAAVLIDYRRRKKR